MPLPTIPSGNVASATAGGFEVANSCRFNDGDNPYMYKAGASGNRDTYTFSYWLKRGAITGADMRIGMFSGTDSTSGTTMIWGKFNSDDTFVVVDNTGSGNHLSITTNRKFRDPSAWYHFVVAVDTTQSTEANRCKIYVNGVQETSFSSATYPSQNTDTLMGIGSGYEFVVSGWKGNTNQMFEGYLAEVVHIDGLALAPTSFGEFDEDSPTIWKPIDVSGLTFGTNGFYLDFEDSSNLGNDANGGTDLTEANLAAADQATDTPTNNFCTISPIDGGVGTYTFSEGNCQIQGTSTSWYTRGSTFAVTKGKWYWEVEFDAGTMIEIMVGVHDTSVDLTATNRWVTGSTLFYNDNGGEVRVDGTETTADYGTLTAGDILGIALNMDDKQITIYDNGSAIVSNLSIGSNITEAMPTFLTDATNVVFKANFGGCPAFTVSSGNADGNGYGNFEYAVPTNYYSLCTKNLAEFG
jgi:hypothetical protein